MTAQTVQELARWQVSAQLPEGSLVRGFGHLEHHNQRRQDVQYNAKIPRLVGRTGSGPSLVGRRKTGTNPNPDPDRASFHNEPSDKWTLGQLTMNGVDRQTDTPTHKQTHYWKHATFATLSLQARVVKTDRDVTSSHTRDVIITHNRWHVLKNRIRRVLATTGSFCTTATNNLLSRLSALTHNKAVYRARFCATVNHVYGFFTQRDRSRCPK